MADAARFDADVSRRLLAFLESCSAGTLAAFDADGTLWSVDVGEAFLKYAGEQGALPNWAKGDAVWLEYEARLAAGRTHDAYELCVTAFEGALDSDVAALAEKFVTPAWKSYVFPAMHGFVSALRKADADVYVVSASPAWCVIPGVAGLGIPASHVIASVPALDSRGRVTAALASPMPLAKTKVDLIVARAGRPPHFAAGNSKWDYEMLESARAMALIIDPADPERGWESRRNGKAWLVQRWAS